MANTTNPNNNGQTYIRPLDLQDPILFTLNRQFSLLFGALPAKSTTSSWTSYTPSIGGTLSLSTVVVNECSYQHLNYMVFLNIDASFTITGGTSKTFTLSYPADYPPATTNSYGNVLPCALVIGGVNIPAIARVTNGSILVQRADNANFATGSLKVLITGFYQTSS